MGDFWPALRRLTQLDLLSAGHHCFHPITDMNPDSVLQSGALLTVGALGPPLTVGALGPPSLSGPWPPPYCQGDGRT
ncbi:unnamed protein product [Boreogadus saida]